MSTAIVWLAQAEAVASTSSCSRECWPHLPICLWYKELTVCWWLQTWLAHHWKAAALSMMQSSALHSSKYITSWELNTVHTGLEQAISSPPKWARWYVSRTLDYWYACLRLLSWTGKCPTFTASEIMTLWQQKCLVIFLSAKVINIIWCKVDVHYTKTSKQYSCKEDQQA